MTKRLAKSAAKELAGLGSRIAIAEYTASDASNALTRERRRERVTAAFPRSIPEFIRTFPDDSACVKYLESVRWPDGFVCPQCGERGEPIRFAAHATRLRCRVCRHDASTTAGTVMHRTHLPLTQWFLAAYLVSTQPRVSPVQFQRQIGIKRYETAFRMLQKLHAGMVRPNVDRIGGKGARIGFRSSLGIAMANESPSYDRPQARDASARARS